MSHKTNHHDRGTGIAIRVAAEDRGDQPAEPGPTAVDAGGVLDQRYLPDDLVTDLKHKYVVHLDVPGVHPEDVVIDLTGQQLTVDGHRAEPPDKGVRLRTSRIHGDFHYCLDLPVPVRARRASSRLRRGVLTITLPKAGPTGPRRIEID